MRVGIVLGAGKEAMVQRLEKALEDGYDKIVISGRRHDPTAIDSKVVTDELGCLDDKLNCHHVEYMEVFTTFGSYLGVCDATNEQDKLVFIGHESHTHRMEVFRRYFNGRNVNYVLIKDPNLKPAHRTFDKLSAGIYRVALRLFPGLIEEQTRDSNSFLNKYIIPLKNVVMNRKIS